MFVCTVFDIITNSFQMSNISPPSPPSLSSRLQNILAKATPVNADEFFNFADNIGIVPGVNAKFESFVVKCSCSSLQ